MMKLFLFAAAFFCAKASDVITLTYDNFEEQTKAVAGDGGVWFVEFYANNCSHCDEVSPVWEEVATELKGKVNVAKVDCKDEANKALAYRFGIKRYPTFYLIDSGEAFKLLPFPAKKLLLHVAIEPDDREAHVGVHGPVPPVVLPADVIPEPELPPPHTGPSDVVTLTDENFEHLTQAASGSTTGDWLIAFHAEWCGHCKFLAPVWEELATELKDEIVVARVDVEENLLVADRFQIKSFPTAIYISKGKMVTFKNKGSRTKKDFLQFIREDHEESESVPPDFTTLEVLLKNFERFYARHKKFTLKRLELAQRDVAKGKYWSPHTVVVLSAFLGGVIFVLVLFVLLIPSKSEVKAAQSVRKKSD